MIKKIMLNSTTPFPEANFELSTVQLSKQNDRKTVTF